MTRTDRYRGWWGVLLLVQVATGWAAALRLDEVLGGDRLDGYVRAEQPRTFVFPRDHGAHPAFRSEWWYLNATLEDARGAAYGVQFTLFRQALRPTRRFNSPWDARQVYLGHLAVSDVEGHRHVVAERLARAHPRLAGVRAEPFHVWLDGWELFAPGPDLTGLTLDASAPRLAVRLELQPARPVVLQGDAGLSRKGPDQASYYYSLPRLSASGTLRIDGAEVAVQGLAWLDREWSTSVLGQGQSGWDWFSLHLDDADLMLFQLRRRDGARDPFDQGTWIRADGSHIGLHGDAFSLHPTAHWTDADGVRWPVSWMAQVTGPDGARELRIEAALDDQRVDGLLRYWEGLVRVLDTAGQQVGEGYMELTGYE